MEESTKKPLMIGIIVACIVIAGIVTFWTRKGSEKGIKSLDPTKSTWLKCNNSECGHEFEMNLREYFKYLQDNVDPATMVTPPIVCPKCGEEACFRAAKCNECGHIFFMNSVAGTFKDTCPKCGYSQIKIDRQNAAAKRRGGN